MDGQSGSTGRYPARPQSLGSKAQEYARRAQPEGLREPQKQLTKERTLMEESNKDNKTKPAYTEKQLEEAVRIVDQAIRDRRREYEKIAAQDNQERIELEGETLSGYQCILMVDPKEVAEIFLRHDYSFWSVLGEDAPAVMWDILAQRFGLSTVCHVDL